MHKVGSVIATTLTVLLGASTLAAAGDHLACYKVKDTLAKATFPGVNLLSNDGGPNQTGCTIATGTKLCCDPVDKVGVPPQPGGSGPGGLTTRFCCYKVKCPKVPASTLDFTDQFGSRMLSIAAPKMVCAPVPTTSTTTTSTTTTTSPPHALDCEPISSCSFINHCSGCSGTGICFALAGGGSACVPSTSCSTPCSSNDECPAGEVCQIDTCCGPGGICGPVCP